MKKSFLTGLVLGMFLAPTLAFGQVVFPQDEDWIPIVTNDIPVGDISGDGVGRRDIVGDSTRPAGYMASDDLHLFGRIRMNLDPRQGSGLAPFSWGFLVDID